MRFVRSARLRFRYRVLRDVAKAKWAGDQFALQIEYQLMADSPALPSDVHDALMTALRQYRRRMEAFR